MNPVDGLPTPSQSCAIIVHCFHAIPTWLISCPRACVNYVHKKGWSIICSKKNMLANNEREQVIVFASRVPPRPFGGLEAWRLGGFEILRFGGLEACCPGLHQALLSTPAIFEFMVASIMFLTMCAPGLSCSEGGDLSPLHSRGNAAQFFAALEERGWAGSSLGSLLGSRWLLFFT